MITQLKQLSIKWSAVVATLMVMLGLVTLTTTMIPGAWGSGPLYFGPATDLGIVGAGVELSENGLTMYYRNGDYDWSVSRSALGGSWGAPVQITTFAASVPTVTADELTLYYSKYGGGYGNYDLWMSTRPDKNSQWTTSINVGPEINTSKLEADAEVSPDNLTLYFRYRNTSTSEKANILYSTRPDLASPWSAPQLLPGLVNSTLSDDVYPSISSDSLVLVFLSNRAGSYSAYDLWYSTRASISDPWGSPANVGSAVNTLAPIEGDISQIDNALYFSAMVGDEAHIFFAPIIPEPSLVSMAGLLLLALSRKKH